MTFDLRGGSRGVKGGEDVLDGRGDQRVIVMLEGIGWHGRDVLPESCISGVAAQAIAVVPVWQVVLILVGENAQCESFERIRMFSAARDRSDEIVFKWLMIRGEHE